MRNFLKIDRPLSWRFTQNFKERYHHKRKESQVSNLKSCLPEEAPKEKPAKDMSKRRAKIESFDFSEGFIGVGKIATSLERLYGGIFLTEFGWNIFAGCFPCLVLFFANAKCAAKKPRRNSVNENSSNVRRNTSPQERWKNYVKRRQSQSCT